jgi:DNA polymerase V
MGSKKTWGGRRKGAGRRSSGPRGEPTRPVRLPVSLAPHIAEIIPFAKALTAGILNLPATKPPVSRAPLYASKIAAGFPSAADDYIEARLDLNERLIKHKEATFFLWAKGDSMIEANIHDGDLLIVDRSIEPKHNTIVVAVVNGGFTVKLLHKRRDTVKLVAANPAYPEIPIKAESELQIFGVVKHVVHTF